MFDFGVTEVSHLLSPTNNQPLATLAGNRESRVPNGIVGRMSIFDGRVKVEGSKGPRLLE